VHIINSDRIWPWFSIKTNDCFCVFVFSLNIEQVNQYLSEIAQANLDKKKDVVKKTLQMMLRNTSAIEQVGITGIYNM